MTELHPSPTRLARDRAVTTGQQVAGGGGEPRPREASLNLALQQLRGVAILLVVASHFSLPNTILLEWGEPITNPGYSGVELFFILSGYVVTRSLLRTGFDLRRFAVRRIFRLYPAMLLFLVVSGLVYAVASSYPAESPVRVIFGGTAYRFLLEALLFLSGATTLVIKNVIYSNGALWSLSVEFEFYLALALGVALILRAADPRQVAPILLQGMLAVTAGLFVARILGLTVAAGYPLPYLLQCKFDFMFAGTLLALLPAGKFTAWVPPRWRGRALASLLLGTLIVLSLHASPLATGAAQAQLESVAMPLALVAMTLVVALAAELEFGLPTRSRLLSATLLWLGDRSYSIYLLHFPCFVITWFILRYTDVGLLNDRWLYGISQIVLGTPVILFAASLSYRYVELPGIRLGSQFLTRPVAHAV